MTSRSCVIETTERWYVGTSRGAEYALPFVRVFPIYWAQPSTASLEQARKSCERPDLRDIDEERKTIFCAYKSVEICRHSAHPMPVRMGEVQCTRDDRSWDTEIFGVPFLLTIARNHVVYLFLSVQGRAIFSPPDQVQITVI